MQEKLKNLIETYKNRIKDYKDPISDNCDWWKLEGIQETLEEVICDLERILED